MSPSKTETLREALTNIICDGHCENCPDFDFDTCINGMTFMELRDIMSTTAEYEPVRHGHWNTTEYLFGRVKAECSVCGYTTHDATTYMGNVGMNFCPDCGSFMRGVTTE